MCFVSSHEKNHKHFVIDACEVLKTFSVADKTFKSGGGYVVGQTVVEMKWRNKGCCSVGEMKSIDASLKLSEQQWRYSEKVKIHPRDNKCIQCQISHQDAGCEW